MAFPLAGLYGPQTVLGQNGTPFVNGSVQVYEADGSTAATLYTDQTMGTGAANPVTTDNFGNLSFYAQPGIYVLATTISSVTTTLAVQVLPWYSNISTGAVVESFRASTSVSLSTTPANVVSVVLAAGTWRINATALVIATGGADIEVWIGPNSASTTGAYAAGGANVATFSYTWNSQITLSKVVTLASSTTVYLCANFGAGSNPSVVAYESPVNSLANVSGISASQLY